MVTIDSRYVHSPFTPSSFLWSSTQLEGSEQGIQNFKWIPHHTLFIKGISANYWCILFCMMKITVRTTLEYSTLCSNNDEPSRRNCWLAAWFHADSHSLWHCYERRKIANEMTKINNKWQSTQNQWSCKSIKISLTLFVVHCRKLCRKPCIRRRRTIGSQFVPHHLATLCIAETFVGFWRNGTVNGSREREDMFPRWEFRMANKCVHLRKSNRQCFHWSVHSAT